MTPRSLNIHEISPRALIGEMLWRFANNYNDVTLSDESTSEDFLVAADHIIACLEVGGYVIQHKARLEARLGG